MDNEKKDVVITYETLYEILRREKGREELQEFPPNFFAEVVGYMADKSQILKENDGKDDLFTATETSKTRIELTNIKRILKDIYERREKKIIVMALNKSRTGSNIIDTSNMMEEETYFFNGILIHLDKYREGVLSTVIAGKVPALAAEIKESEKKEEKTTKLIKFIKVVPKFMGEELESYGPFEEDDMASLPVKIADVLIEKGRAEEMVE